MQPFTVAGCFRTRASQPCVGLNNSSFLYKSWGGLFASSSCTGSWCCHVRHRQQQMNHELKDSKGPRPKNESGLRDHRPQVFQQTFDLLRRLATLSTISTSGLWPPHKHHWPPSNDSLLRKEVLKSHISNGVCGRRLHALAFKANLGLGSSLVERKLRATSVWIPIRHNHFCFTV